MLIITMYRRYGDYQSLRCPLSCLQSGRYAVRLHFLLPQAAAESKSTEYIDSIGLVIRRTGIRMSSISKQGFREKEDAVVFEVVEQEAKR